jgi:hypothetical protein
MYWFDHNKPGAKENILLTSKKIAQMVVAAQWGDANAIDPFLDLEHAITLDVIGADLYKSIAAARKQARKFQTVLATRSAPSGTEGSGEIRIYERDAYLSYIKAIQENRSLEIAPLHSVYDWIIEHGIEIEGVAYSPPPSFDTWARYRRSGENIVRSSQS